MAEVEHWNRPGKGAAWDVLKLGAKRMPGRPTVNVDSELAKLDIKKAKGKQKATQTNEGPENAKVDITLLLESDDDFALLQENLIVLRPTQERKPSEPRTIEHPVTDLAGVAMVVIEKVKWSHPRPVEGMTISLTCTEWVQKPKESGGLNKGKGKGPKTCAQLAAEAQAAWERFAKTQAELEQLEAKKRSGVLLKTTDLARLDHMRGKATQDHNIFLAAVAAADNCKSAKPPSQGAKKNVA